MQEPPLNHGMQEPPLNHGMQEPPLKHGMQEPPLNHGMQEPPLNHGMQEPPLNHGMQEPPLNHGMLIPEAPLLGMQEPFRTHGMHPPASLTAHRTPLLASTYAAPPSCVCVLWPGPWFPCMMSVCAPTARYPPSARTPWCSTTYGLRR